ncbi:MAG TPA: hypothetical protein VF698_18930, partial [Thermoanaerobaculia bacterium]
IDLRDLGASAMTTITTTPLVTARPLTDSVRGAKLARRRGCFGWWRRAADAPMFSAQGPQRVEIDGVLLPPGGSCTASVRIEGIPTGRERDVAVQVQQLFQKQVVGGAVFTIPADVPPPTPDKSTPFRWEERDDQKQDDDEDELPLAGWVREQTEAALRLSGKKPGR